MKSIRLVVPALFALAACDGGTQGAQADTEEAEAAGNAVGGAVAPAPASSPAPDSEATYGGDPATANATGENES